MKREMRTRIIDPSDAIRAAFDLFASILSKPQEFPEEFNGATFAAVERVEQDQSRSVSFQVTVATENADPIPELERVLVEA